MIYLKAMLFGFLAILALAVMLFGIVTFVLWEVPPFSFQWSDTRLFALEWTLASAGSFCVLRACEMAKRGA